MSEEPIYNFVKGQGWVPRIGGYVLTLEDCLGEWVNLSEKYTQYFYPSICAGWALMDISDGAFLVGDVVPYSGGSRAAPCIKVITAIENGRYQFVYYSMGGGHPEQGSSQLPHAFIQVARRV